MKTNKKLAHVLVCALCAPFIACNLPKTALEEEMSPPIADLSISPSVIIADETVSHFKNTSLGNWDTSKWELGYRETQMYIDSFDYVFNYAGEKEITLTVSGVLGFDKTTEKILVYAMNPGCLNYVSPKTQNEEKIKNIRSTNTLITGKIDVKNDFAESVIISVYHSDSWLSGYYKPFESYATPANSTLRLKYQSSDLIVGNDWGISITKADGTKSCIRTIGDISVYNNALFSLSAQRIMSGW
ncbi:MAG: hypothetical protein IT269_07555 [Saprospiraceae bacterium]|nr:hypothetical protein [Saprospiraceae bacterium]